MKVYVISNNNSQDNPIASKVFDTMDKATEYLTNRYRKHSHYINYTNDQLLPLVKEDIKECEVE